MKELLSYLKSKERANMTEEKLLAANFILKEYSQKYKVKLLDLRDSIFGTINIIPAEIIRSVKEDDVKLIIKNQQTIHNLLKDHYGALKVLCKKAHIEDYNEAYILAYDLLWRFDGRVPLLAYLRFYVYRHLKRYARNNTLISIKSSLVHDLKRQMAKKKEELTLKLNRKPTYDELLEVLSWKDSHHRLIFKLHGFR